MRQILRIDKWWAAAVVLVLLMIGSLSRQGIIEQDHYLEYASALRDGSVSELGNDRRLFPGLPIMIAMTESLTGNAVWSGRAVITVCVLITMWWMAKLAGERRTLLALVFPPMVWRQAGLVATEWVVLSMVLGMMAMAMKKRWWRAGILAGASLWVRPIGAAAAVGLSWWMRRKGRTAEWGKVWLPISLSMLGLLVYNIYMFGNEGLLMQIDKYQEYGRATWGVVQLVKDIPRAIDWGWYRQVVSGAGYLVLLGWSLKLAGGKVKASRSEWKEMTWYMAWSMLWFVFLLGPTPFLEEFPRLLVPVFPLLTMLAAGKRVRSWMVIAVSGVSWLVILL